MCLARYCPREAVVGAMPGSGIAGASASRFAAFDKTLGNGAMPHRLRQRQLASQYTNATAKMKDAESLRY